MIQLTNGFPAWKTGSDEDQNKDSRLPWRYLQTLQDSTLGKDNSQRAKNFKNNYLLLRERAILKRQALKEINGKES